MRTVDHDDFKTDIFGANRRFREFLDNSVNVFVSGLPACGKGRAADPDQVQCGWGDGVTGDGLATAVGELDHWDGAERFYFGDYVSVAFGCLGAGDAELLGAGTAALSDEGVAETDEADVVLCKGEHEVGKGGRHFAFGTSQPFPCGRTHRAVGDGDTTVAESNLVKNGFLHLMMMKDKEVMLIIKGGGDDDG